MFTLKIFKLVLTQTNLETTVNDDEISASIVSVTLKYLLITAIINVVPMKKVALPYAAYGASSNASQFNFVRTK